MTKWVSPTPADIQSHLFVSWKKKSSSDRCGSQKVKWMKYQQNIIGNKPRQDKIRPSPELVNGHVVFPANLAFFYAPNSKLIRETSLWSFRLSCWCDLLIFVYLHVQLSFQLRNNFALDRKKISEKKLFTHKSWSRQHTKFTKYSCRRRRNPKLVFY